MKLVKRFTCLCICMVLMVSLFIPASAATGSTSVRYSLTRYYTATGNLDLAEKSVLATTNYETMADALNIHITITVRNTATGATSSVNATPVITLDTAYTFSSKSAGANEVFMAATSLHRITTYFESKDIYLSE